MSMANHFPVPLLLNHGNDTVMEKIVTEILGLGDCRPLEKSNKLSCSAEKWQEHSIVQKVCTAIAVFVLLASPTLS